MNHQEQNELREDLKQNPHAPDQTPDPTKFMKFDQEKNRLELIEPAFIEGVGKVMTFGAKKYEAHNWKRMTSTDLERIHGAALRHINAYQQGQKTDPETGLSHLYHATCCLMFLDYFDRNRKMPVNMTGKQDD